MVVCPMFMIVQNLRLFRIDFEKEFKLNSDHTRSSWTIFGPFWTILNFFLPYFEPFWTITDHIMAFWTILDPLGPY